MLQMARGALRRGWVRKGEAVSADTRLLTNLPKWKLRGRLNLILANK
jgi:hypothetical protein